MELLRHWRRGTFGVAAGALVVPGAILLAALAVGIGGGGLAGLGSLGQALNGPAAPRQAAFAQPRPSRDAGRLLARVNRRAAAQTRAAAATGSAPGAGGTATTTPGGRARQGGFSPGSGSTPPATPPPPTAPTPPPVSTPAPTATSVVRAVGKTVTSITDNVPVVGPTTSHVVDDVVDTVDSILPPG